MLLVLGQQQGLALAAPGGGVHPRLPVRMCGVCVCIYMCMYIYICVCIYIYMYVYVYACVYNIYLYGCMYYVLCMCVQCHLCRNETPEQKFNGDGQSAF